MKFKFLLLLPCLALVLAACHNPNTTPATPDKNATPETPDTPRGG